MNIKDLAEGVRRLQRDEVFNHIIEKIKEDKANIFLNPHSSLDDRENAHVAIQGLSEIEDRMATILADEAIFDKQQGKESAPWKRLSKLNPAR